LNITLHVSDGLSVRYQEFKTVRTASSICHTHLVYVVKVLWLLAGGQEMEMFHLVPASKQPTMFIFNYVLQPLKAYLRSGLDIPHFATRRLHACHHARAPSGGSWNCGREMSGKFCLNADFHVTFRDPLYAVTLYSSSEGGRAEEFFALKSDGFGTVRTNELGYQRPARYL